MKIRTRLTLITIAALSVSAAVVPAQGPANAAADRIRQEGPLVRYDTTLVPQGATARVQAVQTSANSTMVTLHVSGLSPNRDYGAHVHTSPCGATGAAAGPHYQNLVPIPPQTPTDPAYGNADNEVWLDFTTDSKGKASAHSLVRWQPRPGGAGSVVLHERHTSTAAGSAGTAGARVACLTVPF